MNPFAYIYRRNRCRPWSWLALLMLGTLPVSHLHAQSPRTRTLTYDPASRKFVEQPPPPPGTPEGDLHRVRVLVRDQQFKPALKAIKRFTRTHGGDFAWQPDLLILEAEALIGRKHYDRAHDVLQVFLNQYGGMALTAEALRLEFIIAEAFLKGAKVRFLGIPLLSGKDRAYRILDEISAEYHDSPFAELAIKTKADHLFADSDHDLAELEYSRLLREYPRSRFHQYAMGRAAESALASFAGVHYDEAALIEAEARYAEYRRRYPVEADREGVGLVLQTIQEMQAEKEYLIAEYYEKTDHIASAVFYYRHVRERWPESIAGTRATRRLELLGVLEPVEPEDATEQGMGG